MNKEILGTDIYLKIDLVLGRDILPIEEGNVRSLVEFSENDISDFRLLASRSGVLAISYIRYRVEGRVSLSVLFSFLSGLVEQGISIQEWMRNDQS